MASTPGLAAPLWTASQNHPDVTVNSGTTVLDSCIAGQTVIDFPADADYTFVGGGAYPRSWQYAVIEMTDTGVPLTGPVNVIVLNPPRMYNFFNNTTGAGGQTLTVKRATGTGIAVPAGKRVILQNDGTNVVQWTAFFP